MLSNEWLFHRHRILQIWHWMWFKVLLKYRHPWNQMKALRQNMLGERRNRFYLHRTESSASLIVSCEALCCATYPTQRACSLLSASRAYVPPRLVPSNICLPATKPCRPIYVETHCPIRGPSKTIKATWWDPGEKCREGRGEEGRMEEENAQELEEGVWGKQAPKNNETKSEDKRGAISVAGFMYCQHYPRY